MMSFFTAVDLTNAKRIGLIRVIILK